ncbi:MAG: hypothetical protein WCA56_23240 [Xanthobacteraceae bacterium]|jgi:predicted RNA-binding Zn-ribbon protein involved in translation (DUF1610 family)
MYALHEPQRYVREPLDVPHPCPNCGRTMQLTRGTAHTGGISDVQSYGCAECGIWTVETANDSRRIS